MIHFFISMGIVCVILFGCSDDNSSEYLPLAKSEVAQLDNQLESPINFSELFSIQNAELIPLLMNNEGLLTGNLPEKILFHKSWYLILDQLNDNLKVFNLDGSYYASYGTKGKGPEELMSLCDFYLSDDDDIIYVLDYIANKIVIYDLHERNKVVGSKMLKNSNLAKFKIVEGVSKFNNEILLLAKKEYNDSQNGIIFLDSTMTFSKVVLYPDNIVGRRQANRNAIFTKSNNDLLFLKNFSDTIWIYKNQSFYPKYVISLPEDMVHADNNGTEKTNFDYQNYLETNRFVCVTYFINALKYWYVYDKEVGHGKLVSTSDDGFISRADIPLSELFYATDSIMYGYLEHSQVVSRYENITNLLKGHGGVNLNDKLKIGFAQELQKLEMAMATGNGLIVKYNLKISKSSLRPAQ